MKRYLMIISLLFYGCGDGLNTTAIKENSTVEAENTANNFCTDEMNKVIKMNCQEYQTHVSNQQVDCAANPSGNPMANQCGEIAQKVNACTQQKFTANNYCTGGTQAQQQDCLKQVNAHCTATAYGVDEAETRAFFDRIEGCQINNPCP